MLKLRVRLTGLKQNKREAGKDPLTKKDPLS